MASDRLYEFNGKKGHWYTDDQGNRYFVAQGQTPKEGWEATKRRKMIKGGKYVKDDGDDKGEQEISANEYQTYEADEEERFDETVDADFEDDKPEDFDRDDWEDDEEGKAAGMNSSAKWKYNENDLDMIGSPTGNELLGEWFEKNGNQVFGDKENEQYVVNEIMQEFGLSKANAIRYYRQKTKGIDRNAEENDLNNDGTNGWKPSDEATPAYDVGGFYSIKEGDEWDYEDGGYVKVEKVNGDEVTISTPGGNRETITKDELSERVKRAWKVPASGNNPLPDRDGWRGESGSQTVNSEYKSAYDPEDFEDARYYKNSSGSGREYYDIASAHGIADEESYRNDFKNRFKIVGQTKDGADIYQGPDGYFSTNPLVTSMSFRTKEALQDYEDKRTTDYAYGGYNKENPNISAPEAYAAARRNAGGYKNEQPKPKKTVGEDLQEMYEREFFKQANGNKEDFVNHFINRFGVPRGSSRKREAEFYGKRFDELSASQKQSEAQKIDGPKNEEPQSNESIEKEVNSYKGGIEGVDEHMKDICDKYGCRFITSKKIDKDTVEVCIGGVTGNEWFKVKNTGSDANPNWYGGDKLVDYIKKSAEKSGNTINTAFDYLKKLYDDPENRASAIRKTVEKFPNATNDEIGRVMEKLIEYSKGKK